MSEFIIKIDIKQMDDIVIEKESFKDLYIAKKIEAYNDFELKAFNVLSEKEKLSFKEENDEKLLNKLAIEIKRDLEIYKYIKDDDMYLRAGVDIYEVIYICMKKRQRN